ncbi:MAG: TIGR03621 family F420-dependent LLM class oxidoreductase [Microthrixaceae bacterium]
MAHPRRFRFGIQLSQPFAGTTWQETARRVEELGYSTLFVPDHFGDQLAPITALAVAAEATTTLRVGALVFDNDYRHPVVLATETATLDVLSAGRVELGLGAGWMATDYEQSGMPYDRAGVRVDRFAEGLAVIKGLWGDEPVTFAGEHYTITGLDGRPKPHTPGGPPVLVGGGGRRVLSIAARSADIVGVNPNLKAGEIGPDAIADAMAGPTDEKVAWVREAAGERFDDLELNVLSFVSSITDDPATLLDGMAAMFGVGSEEITSAPTVVVGTRSGAAELLEARRERWGFSYYVFQGDSAEVMAPLVADLTGR